MHSAFQKCATFGPHPGGQACAKGNYIPVHKDKLDCSNYRGISLLCQGSKVFSSIILHRIKNENWSNLSEAQEGSTKNHVIDQIFTLRQFAENIKNLAKTYMSVMLTSVKRLIVFGGQDYGKLCDTMDIQRKSFGYLKMPTRIRSVLLE